MKDCIFCSIVKGDVPCHKVWESNTHLAFLDIFPNTEGVTVVISKDHEGSDPCQVNEKTYVALMLAAWEVGKLLVEKMADVGRVGIMIEGTGVDHLHAKLFPMHGTVDGSWQAMEEKRFFTKYPGFISSNTAEQATEDELASLARKIRT